MLSNVHEKKAVWWLFQTFPPVRARAERVDVKKVAPSAEPGQRFKIKDYLRVTIDKDWLILPQVHLSDFTARTNRMMILERKS